MYVNIEEIKKLIVERPSHFMFILKKQDKQLYDYINQNFNGNTFSEKIYCYINKEVANLGKCEECGKQCRFLNIKLGYSKRCSYTCMGKIKKEESREIRNCVICNKEFEIYKIREKTTCSDNCLLILNKSEPVNNKRIGTLRKTMLTKYGVDSFSKTKDFSIKLKDTKLKHYGDENYVNPTKAKKTKLEKYGDENYTNRDKAKLTCLEKYGVNNVSKTDEYIDKCKKTNLEKYGVEHFSKTKEYKNIHAKKVVNRLKDVLPIFDIETYSGVTNKKYEFKCIKCDTKFTTYLNNGHQPVCKNCHPSPKSKSQLEISSFIKSICNDKIEENTRSIISPLELDIYIPSKKLAIEYNGLYWHGELSGGHDKKYHLNKTELCEKQGIQLIHIFEDEWIYKTDIIKNKIKNLLNISSTKIYARNCLVTEIDAKTSSKFLNINHLQGNSNASIRIGAYYKDELVSVMTFGKLRKSLGCSSADNTYEMYRFCIGSLSVVGVAGKLLNYFIKKYNPSKIISYADRRYSIKEKCYLNKLGFTLLHMTSPGYYYILEDTKINRFNFRKDVLEHKLEKFNPLISEWQNMQLNGYDRIWDCGHLKYEWCHTPKTRL